MVIMMFLFPILKPKLEGLKLLNLVSTVAGIICSFGISAWLFRIADKEYTLLPYFILAGLLMLMQLRQPPTRYASTRQIAVWGTLLGVIISYFVFLRP